MQGNFDVQSKILIKTALLTHGQTATSQILDMNGADNVRIVVAAALAGGTNGTNPVVSFETSDTTDSTAFATAVANATLPTAETDDQLVYEFDKRGHKRYLRLRVTPPSGSTNNNCAPLFAVASLGQLQAGAVDATSKTGSATSIVVHV